MRNWILRRWLERTFPVAPTATLRVTELEDRTVPVSLPPGNYSDAGNPLPSSGTAFEFDQVGTYTITGNLTVNPGVMLTAGKAGTAVNVVITNGSLVTVAGTLNVTSPTAFQSLEDTNLGSDRAGRVAVAGTGTLALTNAKLTRFNNFNNGAISSVTVASGGTFTSGPGSQIDWDQVRVANGGLLGGVTGTAFDTDLFVPAGLVSQFANNPRFRDVYLNANSPLGATLDLELLGTETTANQRYVFGENFDIPQGATVRVRPGTRTLIRNGATVTVGGVLDVTSPAAFQSLEDTSLGSDRAGRVAVSGTGRLALTSANLTRANGFNNGGVSAVTVASGGTFTAADSQIRWDEVRLANGSLLPGAGVTNTLFETTLYTPALFVRQFQAGGNPQFQDVYLIAGSAFDAQPLDLAPLGTVTTAGQRYVFAENLTVPQGATVRVRPGASVLIRNGATVTVAGKLEVDNPAAFQSLEDTSLGSDRAGRITVAGTGGLALAGTALSRANGFNNGGQSAVTVESGGRVDILGGNFAWDLLDLKSGSQGSVQYSSTADKSVFQLDAGTAVGFTNNDFSGIGANGVAAIGATNVVIPFEGNYWGTTLLTSIETRVLHKPDAPANTRPLVDFDAPLEARPVRAVVTATAAVTFSPSAQTVALSATLSSPSGPISGGTATFTVLTTAGATVGSPVPVNVTGPTVTATYTLPAGTPAGSYTVRVDYVNGNFSAGSGTATLAVNPAAASGTAAGATATYNGANQPVTFSATVTSPAGTVGQGTVTFTVLAGTVTVLSGTAPVAGGAASGTFTLPGGTGAGAYTVRATYDGGTNFLDFTFADQLLIVNKAAAPAITSTPPFATTYTAGPGSVGVAVTLASPAGAVNGGIVRFQLFNGAAAVGGPVDALVVNNVAGNTLPLPAGLAAGGAYTVRAEFIGSTNFNDATVALPLTVNKAGSAVAADPVRVLGAANAQTVNLSAVVTSPSGPVNTGSVEFAVLGGNGAPLNGVLTAAVGAGGRATVTYTLPAGTPSAFYTIRAVYSGTANLDGSADQARQLAVAAPTTTAAPGTATVTYSATTQTVTVSTTVTSTGGPAVGGTVQFTVAGVTAIVNVGPGGQAVAVVTLPAGLASGTYAVRASYAGAGLFADSAAPDGTLTVARAGAGGTVTAGPATFNAAAQTVTATAAVTGGGAPAAGGTVTFALFRDGAQVGEAVDGAVVNGSAAAALALPGGSPAGAYVVRATYSGGANVLPGALPDLVFGVGQAGVTVTGRADATAFSAGPGALTVSADITSPGGPVTGGTVTFTLLRGSAPAGGPVEAAVVNGRAAATIALPPGTGAGDYTLAVRYSGAANFAPATATAAAQVGRAGVAVTATAAPAEFRTGGATLALSAAVTSPSGPVNGGAATFQVFRDGAPVGAPVTAAVAGGSAAVAYALPAGSPAGDYSVRVTFGGTNDLAGAEATAPTAVTPAGTAVTFAAATATARPGGVTVTLTATVASPAGTVNDGSVTFAVLGRSVAARVVDGRAVADVSLPAGTAAGEYAVTARYAGPASLAGSAGSGVLTLEAGPAVGLVGGRGFAAGSGGPGGVRAYAPDGTQRLAADPFPGFAGGVRVASADFTGDGVADLVAGTGPGRATRVVVTDGATGRELFAVDPFEERFQGGVFVAAGDITGDGVPDLVITPDQGGGPRVRVFSGGAGFNQVADFFGIEDTTFRGGARAAVGDLNGDGVGDLVVAAGFGGGPRMAGFDGTSLSNGALTRKLFGDFFAFEEGLRNGAYATVGDVDGDGLAELIAGGGPGGGPRVSAFSGAGLLRGEQARVADFFAGDPANRGGVRLAAADLDGDDRADIVTGAGDGAGSRVTGYAGTAVVGGLDPAELFGFDAVPGLTAGVFVG